jgi:hypothetical protein
MRLTNKPILSCLLMCLGAPLALADPQAPSADAQGTPDRSAAPTPADRLPPPVSTHEPYPEVPSPAVALPPGGIIKQAGIGSPVAYGRVGVLELGGSAGLTVASGFRDVNVSPSLGWFITDNIEVTTIASISNVKAGGRSATVWSGLVEPSYHLPFTRTMFGFLGMGMGVGYTNAHGLGMAIAPRLGANLLIGRSGILTPSLSYEYLTHDAMHGASDETLVAVTSSLRVNVGYTVMW